MKDAQIFQGDCLTVLQEKVQSNSINLVVTSPPYANQRKDAYGGIHPDMYSEWFMPRSAEIFRTLQPNGSFVLNIKEHSSAGERHPYVMDLVLNLRRKQGWRLVDEYVWHKKNSVPGKWPNRFRDAWEHIYHFTKEKKFKMNQDAVMVAPMPSTVHRTQRLSPRDHAQTRSATGSKFTKNVSAHVGRTLVYPSNVLHMPVVSFNKNHPAPFPIELPTFFVKLLTDPNDIVLDPFAGTGTTINAALQLGRRAIGIDNSDKYVRLMLANSIERTPILPFMQT